MNLKIFAGLIGVLMTLSVQAQLDRSKMPEPGPAPTITLEVPGEFEMDNGIKVLIVEDHKLPRAMHCWDVF